MAAVLGTNMASIWASKSLQSAQSNMATSVERLSSGLRINRARDDAAGLSISNALTSQINGANQGLRNLNDAISLVQTAEGAISAASEMAQRINTLAVQGKSDTQSNASRAAIKIEMQQLLVAINGISDRTTFGGVSLLDEVNTAGTTAKFQIQVSANSTDIIDLRSDGFKAIGAGEPDYDVVETSDSDYTAGDTYTVYAQVGTAYVAHTFTKGASATTSKIDGVTTADTAIEANYFTLATGTEGQADNLNDAIELIVADGNTDASEFDAVVTAAQAYIVRLDTQRSILGALQNELEFSVSNVTELSANQTAARSRVQDTDYSAETANLTKGQILQQAATAMLAQANQMPNVILSLLK
jgi:flagellin